MSDGGIDLDSDSFAAVQSSTCTTAGTSGVLDKCTIAFTDGAQMDSWAAGNPGRIEVGRDGANDSTNDTMTGDAEFQSMICNET